MKTIKHSIQEPKSESGQGFVEYAIILILVGIVVVLVVSLMQPAIGDVFSRFVAQAPVAPPELLNYTPPPTYTPTPTIDPFATETPVPTATDVPTETPVPTNTFTPTATPVPSDTPVPPPCDYGPHAAPATGPVRIQIEDFRCGGPGVSFSDQNEGGPGSGAYRTDFGAEGPDLEGTSDTGGGYNLGWTQNGEWLEYEISATTNSSYTFIIRYAAPNNTSPQVQIRTTFGGLQANTPTLSLPPTGGTQVWQNYITQVILFEGTNIVRFNIPSGGANFNYFDVQPFVPTATPTPVTPTATPVPTDTPVPTSPPVPVTVTLYSYDDHDGYVRERDQTNQGQNNQVDTNGNYIIVGDNNDNNNEQYKGFVSFNTSGIPNNATITRVELRLQQQGPLLGNPFGNLGTLYADIGPLNGFSGSNSLQATDFQTGAAANNVIALSQTSGDDQWSTGLMGAANFDFINRGGYTQFRIHFQSPDDGDRNYDQFRFDSSNAGPNNQPPAPELIITYTVP